MTTPQVPHSTAAILLTPRHSRATGGPEKEFRNASSEPTKAIRSGRREYRKAKLWNLETFEKKELVARHSSTRVER